MHQGPMHESVSKPCRSAFRVASDLSREERDWTRARPHTRESLPGEGSKPVDPAGRDFWGTIMNRAILRGVNGKETKIRAVKVPPIPKKIPETTFFETQAQTAQRFVRNIRQAWKNAGRNIQVYVTEGSNVIRSNIGPGGVPSSLED